MPDPAQPLAGRRILVVEDEYFIAMDTKQLLEAAGAEVIGPAPNVKRALTLIEDDRPDAAVLDINLGQWGNVYPVADRLAVLDVPYLFATGEVRAMVAAKYRGRPWLDKPYPPASLVSAVTDLTA